MERGKERAELRTDGLKKLMIEFENKRDSLLDEVARKRGEADLAEAAIKRIHEMILDINKEEKSAQDLEDKLQAERAPQAEQKEKNASQKEKVEEALRGKKNSGKTKEIQNRARAVRGKARKKREE